MIKTILSVTIIKFTIFTLVGATIFSQSSFAENSSNPMIIEQLQRFSLAEQMPTAKEFDVRMRKIVVASGEKIAKHNHIDRAGMVYVISGEIVEFRNGKVMTLKSGDSLVEDFNTVHAYENKSNEDCVLIAFDIPKSKTNKHLEKYIKK